MLGYGFDMSASTWFKNIVCHADHYTVSKFYTKGESEKSIAHRWESMQAIDPLRTDVSPKQGY